MTRDKNSKDRPDAPRPFGVDYVPKPKRVLPKAGHAYVGRLSEIPPGRAKAIDLDKFKVAVFNVEGKFYAIKDACPHAEYPLVKGTLQGEVVQCANHNWQFNVRTGQCVRGEPDTVVRRFAVELRGDEIWIKI